MWVEKNEERGGGVATSRSTPLLERLEQAISELINKRKSRKRDISIIAENKPCAHHKTNLHTIKVYNTRPVSLTTEVLLIEIVLFFDHWRICNHLFQSIQRFQAIEFVDRPVPKKLDMEFLFYGHEVLQVKYVTAKLHGQSLYAILHSSTNKTEGLIKRHKDSIPEDT